jgi:hypothetical protein
VDAVTAEKEDANAKYNRKGELTTGWSKNDSAGQSSQQLSTPGQPIADVQA